MHQNPTKHIIILRHADWDETTQAVTDQGKEKIQALKESLPAFSFIISSPERRAEETASLLTNTQPALDARASVLDTAKEQIKAIQETRKRLGISTLEAILSFPELEAVVRQKGLELIDLIRGTFHTLSDGQAALIVSHDGVMVSAEKQLKGESLTGNYYSYGELEGFAVDEAIGVRKF